MLSATRMSHDQMTQLQPTAQIHARPSLEQAERVTDLGCVPKALGVGNQCLKSHAWTHALALANIALRHGGMPTRPENRATPQLILKATA